MNWQGTYWLIHHWWASVDELARYILIDTPLVSFSGWIGKVHTDWYTIGELQWMNCQGTYWLIHQWWASVDELARYILILIVIHHWWASVDELARYILIHHWCFRYILIRYISLVSFSGWIGKVHTESSLVSFTGWIGMVHTENMHHWWDSVDELTIIIDSNDTSLVLQWGIYKVHTDTSLVRFSGYIGMVHTDVWSSCFVTGMRRLLFAISFCCFFSLWNDVYLYFCLKQNEAYSASVESTTNGK